MGRPTGSRTSIEYSHVCKFFKCKEPFKSRNANSEYCSINCRQNDYELRKKIEFGNIYRCIICQMKISPDIAVKHYNKHLKEMKGEVKYGK